MKNTKNTHTKKQWQKLTCVKHPVQQIVRCEITTTVHIIKSPIDCVRNSPLAMNRKMAYKISSPVQKEKSLRLFRKSMMIFLICWHEKTNSYVENSHRPGKSFRLEEPTLSRC